MKILQNEVTGTNMYGNIFSKYVCEVTGTNMYGNIFSM
jgi:hypothetical protein